MPNEIKGYKLVGGVYFALLMSFRDKKTDNKNYLKDERTFFEELLSSLKLDKIKDVVSPSRISQYKSCRNDTLTNNFASEVNTRKDDYETYAATCESLKTFFDENFKNEENKKNLLIAIRNLLLEDSDIKNNDKFRVTDSGGFLTRKEIAANKTFIFEPFILGTLLHAVLVPNSKGKETYEALFEKGEKAYHYNGILYNKNDSKIKITHFKKQVSFTPTKEEQTKFQDEKLDYSLTHADFDYFYESCRDDFENCSLIDKIKEKQKLYITTESFKEGLKKLERNGVLVITGNPGDGKSTTAEMIAVKYTSIHKCTIHYYYGYNEVGNIIQQFKTNPNIDTEELYYIDDFMGQAVYELNNMQESKLSSLCSFIRINKAKKKLLLCSRIKIIEEAKNKNTKNETINRILDNDNCIEISINEEEKGLVLLSHILQKTDEAHYNDVKQDNRYLKIINHPSFNPRVIEHVCNNIKNIPLLKNGEFYQYFIEVLNNPNCIWADVYNNNITEKGRILLFALYSITNESTSILFCKKVFNLLIEDLKNLSSTHNHFEEAVSELNNSMVKISLLNTICGNSPLFISFVDPSVHDYLKNSIIHENPKAFELLKKGIISSKQVNKLLKDDSILYYKKLAESGKLFNLVFHDDDEEFAIITQLIINYKMMSGDISSYFETNLSKYLEKKIEGTFYQANLIKLLITFLEDSNIRNYYLNKKISYSFFYDCILGCSFDDFYEVLNIASKNKNALDFDFLAGAQCIVEVFLTFFISEYTPSFSFEDDEDLDSTYKNFYIDGNYYIEEGENQLIDEINYMLKSLQTIIPNLDIKSLFQYSKERMKLEIDSYLDLAFDAIVEEMESRKKEKTKLENKEQSKIDELFSHSYEELMGKTLI